MLSIPITCPTCGRQNIEQFRELVVLSFVARGNRMWLHSTCHPAQWSGSVHEMQQIREFLDAKEKLPEQQSHWDLSPGSP